MTRPDINLRDRLPTLAARARIVAEVRRFFDERGFLEVETPARVVCPGLEPHLVALPAGPDRWLRTSPELHLKRLLAAGAERIYEIARSFRGDETGPWHMTEFTLLEWYRANEGLDALVDDVHGLLRRCAEAAGADPSDVRGCDLTLAPEEITVRDAVRAQTGIDLAEHRDRGPLAERLAHEGIAVSPGDDWDDLFFKLFIERVEPHLGRERVTILSEFPASQSALARVRVDPTWPVALRFEVFASGIELANAFDELTDPMEQRRRHEADRAARAAAGREVPPLDEAFLAALEAGCPPAAGIALGLDRLVALVLGLTGARGTVAFPQ
ncbi:MAG: EF-P lysine aminoacylase EpmA [Acidobacteriota bacterium]|nr:EF-P lysine aminoacylase EpmA [Acidobacteriota bacterium]